MSYPGAKLDHKEGLEFRDLYRQHLGHLKVSKLKTFKLIQI